MSDNYSLIIKNGSCYIDGKLIKTDLGLSGKRIKKIGKIQLNSSKVFDATNKTVLPPVTGWPSSYGGKNRVRGLQKNLPTNKLKPYKNDVFGWRGGNRMVD